MKLSLLVLVLLYCNPCFSVLCPNWSTSKIKGVLDKEFIDESSGLALSILSPNRLFHINDSGDGPYFYVSSLDGTQTKAVRVLGFRPHDVEDLAYGKCMEGSCLFIGDIGDNKKSRKTIQIVRIKDSKKIGPEVRPMAIIRAKYPAGPRNAEAMAIHPNGDLFIITKKSMLQDDAQIYKLTSKQINNNDNVVQALNYVGSLNLSKILKGKTNRSQMITGMDISPNGKKFMLITYKKLIEVAIDLSQATPLPPVEKWKKGKDYQFVPITTLSQQEAVTYTSDGNKVLYSTEYKRREGEPKLMINMCQL